MAKINSEILLWARKTAGLTIEEACKKLGINKAHGYSPVERLQQLENGEVEPSRTMLNKMSKQYRRPLLAFYLETPPRKDDSVQDFRTLPDDYPDVSRALIDALIRNIQVRQSIIKSALEEEEEDIPLEFVGAAKLSDGIDECVRVINKYINIDLDLFRKKRTPKDGFDYLRSRVEEAGIFVILVSNLGSHHTTIDVRGFRGFALSDKVAPFIVINEKDAKAAWSFTLLHELCHIFLGHTGISGGYAEQVFEKFCNQVAGKILLRDEDIALIRLYDTYSLEEKKEIISEFASDWNISSTMLAYNLHLSETISHSDWQWLRKTYFDLWHENQEANRNKVRQKGTSFSNRNTRRHRLGKNVIGFVERTVAGGVISTTKAGVVLGVSPQKLHNLFDSRSRPRARQ